MYRVFCALLASVFMTAAAWAGQDDWTVAKVSQPVNYTLNKQKWLPVRVGDIIPNTAWVSTGSRGRIQLVRGVESLTFQPDTLAGLFTKGTTDTKTEIVQQTGTLDLEIERRDHPHTTVQTPYFAAVVKGTKFTVSVTKEAAEVSVNRGLVQVSSFKSGQRADVGPGQSASVSSTRGMSVAGKVSSPTITSTPPTAAKVQAINATPTAAPPSTKTAPADAATTGPTSSRASKADTGVSRSEAGKSQSDGGTRASGSGSDGRDGSDKPDGNKSDKPNSDKPGKPDGDKPGKPDGDKPGKPGGDKPDGDKPGKPGGDKPGKPDGDKPGKPDGDKPGKPDGDKPGKP
ncbi:FecR domain-containing protein, partial [Neorhizobium alkalisoli]|uniref:FecR domain-containing protein n=1 Tax=Neorhizobium alkalisoli TaxID=528178 RepID=UPI0011A97D31